MEVGSLQCSIYVGTIVRNGLYREQRDIIWKSRGGIMVNGVSREVLRGRRPLGFLAAGPPEAVHSQ